MLLTLLFLIRDTAAVDDYKYELKHVFNPNCETFNPSKPIDDISDYDKNYLYLRECKNLGTVTYNDDSIPQYAFYASSLTQITLSADTTSIGKGAFAYCDKLTSIKFNDPTKTTSIAAGAFYHSGLTSITGFPDIQTINEFTFEGCPLTNYELDLRPVNNVPKKLTTISERAFYGSNISSIILPNDMDTIDKSAFENCQMLKIGGSNPIIRSKTIKSYAFRNCPLVNEIIVNAETIGIGAFHCDTSLKPTIINEIRQYTTTTTGEPPVTTKYGMSIDSYAFYGREVKVLGLQKIADLTIGDFAFANCTFSKSGNANGYGIQIDNKNAIIIGNHAFYMANFGSNTFSLVIGESKGASEIGFHAFESSRGTISLSFVEEKGGPITIKDYAFYRSGVINTNPDLESNYLRFPTRVSQIGEKAFAECQSIAGGVYIKDTSIGEFAFYNCKNIKKIIIHNCNTIGKGAFEACLSTADDIKSLTITCDRDITDDTTDVLKSKTTTIGDRAFYASGLNCPLVLHSSITSIGEYAFAYCTKLVGNPITINAGEIGAYAFSNCGTFTQPITIHSKNVPFHCFDENTLNYITIGGTLEGNGASQQRCAIETEAFYDIEFASVVNIESTADIGYNGFQLCRFKGDININGTIEAYAFDNCTCLTGSVTLTIGDVGDVGKLAFLRFGKLNKFKLRFIEVSQGSNTIEDYAFYEANITGDVVIPWYFSDINKFAFTNCTDISSVVVNNSNIGKEAFAGCTNLKNLELYSHKNNNDGGGNEMNTIGIRAFYSLGITSDLIIPNTVSSIKDEAFANCKQIKRLVIESESSITNIGESAFENCEKMAAEINVTKSLTTISSKAFRNCAALTKIIFYNDDTQLANIQDSAFANCTKLNGVLDFPKTCKNIGEYAFYRCSGITHHLSIQTVCNIGDYAFYGCSGIKRVELNFDTDGETTNYYRIGAYAFAGLQCYNNFHLGEDDPDQNIEEEEEVEDILFIPYQIYAIGESAFEGCTGLRGVKIEIGHNYWSHNYDEIGIFNRSFYGSSIRSVQIIYGSSYNFYPIRYHAFANCQNLVSGINIEGGTFYGYTFENCNGLIGGITITGGSFKDGTFANCRGLTGAKPISISGGSFGQSTFANCSSLVNGITISGGTFDDYTFANCTNLKGGFLIGGNMNNYAFVNCVNLGPNEDNVTLYLTGSLGRHCFDGCTSFGGILELRSRARIGESAFEDFNMPFTLRCDSTSYSASIDHRAFYHCSLVGPLDIRGVDEIGNEAFANCPNSLYSLTLGPSSSCGINVFTNTRFANNNADKIVMLTAYLNSKFNQYTFRGVKGLNRLTLFGNGDVAYKSFYEMSELEGELILPSDTNNVEGYAFAGCGFHNIVFNPNKVTLNEGVFENCRRLNGTIHLKRIDNIPKRAFYGCSNLKSITFDQNFAALKPKFGRSAFEDCSSLNFYIEMPDKVSGLTNYRFKKYVFAGCSSLDGINGLLKIPTYVDKINDYAFRDCAFTRLEFNSPNSRTTLIIGTGAFSGCNKLTHDLILPKVTDIYGNDKIPDRAFSGCSGLQSIEYADTIDTIGKYAFSGCSGVRGPLEIKPSVKRIEEYAFSGCSGFSGHLTINVDPGKGQTIIGAHAFDGCKGFKKGSLTFFIESEEESQKAYTNIGQNQNQFPYFRYNYFLRIGAKAFEDTKFSNIYYNGRFQPDCDFDIGFSHTKGIHTSSNYLNKTFCNYPLHSSKLSGGAIAGITIAVIVVVAVIVFLIIFFILRNKKNKDNSEDEVEMNADP